MKRPGSVENFLAAAAISLAGCGDGTNTVRDVIKPPSESTPNLPNQPEIKSPEKGEASKWLENNPKVARQIRWEFTINDRDGYTPPIDSSKVSWESWTPEQKKFLDEVYTTMSGWIKDGAPKINNPQIDGLTDQPPVSWDLNAGAGSDNSSVVNTFAPAEYMWKLFATHVAWSIALENSGKLPWSITAYDDESLRLLFDSTNFAWKNGSSSEDDYILGGTYALHIPTKRIDNTAYTTYGSPRYAFSWLKENSIIDTSSQDTIVKTLDWMRKNMAHFFGSTTYKNMEQVWGYRGLPPLSKIIEGTVDQNVPQLGKQHYTAGCHGSVGFLAQVLRAANIPVQPVWVAGHELAYFPTDGKYLDHGDNPYNSIVRGSPRPSSDLLIDKETYRRWFTLDESKNIIDPEDPAGLNVGRTAKEF